MRTRNQTSEESQRRPLQIVARRRGGRGRAAADARFPGLATSKWKCAFGLLAKLDLSTPEVETPETVAARIRRALRFTSPILTGALLLIAGVFQ